MTTLLDRAEERLEGDARAAAFNPFSPQFLADPYPTYRRLRREAPLFAVQGCMGRDWIATRYATIESILADTRFGVDDLPQRIRAAAARLDQAHSVEQLCTDLSHWLFFIDTPSHEACRKSLCGLFRRPCLERLGLKLTERARAIVARQLAGTGLDVVDKLAAHLPAFATCGLLGIEDADLSVLASLSSAIFEVFAQPLSLRRYQGIDTKLRALHGLIEHFADAQNLAGAGVLRDMREQVKHGTVSREAWLAFCGMLFSVGQDTSLGLIANAVLTLVQHKHTVQRAIDISRPPPIALLRELVRFNPPVQMIVRVAMVDATIDGAPIRAGERVHLFLGSAMHDEAVFDEPERLDPDRKSTSTLHFGSGRHFCLGSQLALLQLEAAVSAILPVLPMLEIDEASFKWLSCTHLRRPQTLRLRAPIAASTFELKPM